jgi:hypothetical protein
MTNFTPPYPPIFETNNIFNSTKNYDTSNTVTDLIKPTVTKNQPLENLYQVQKSNNISILKGKRDGAPEFLNSTY